MGRLSAPLADFESFKFFWKFSVSCVMIRKAEQNRRDQYDGNAIRTEEAF